VDVLVVPKPPPPPNCPTITNDVGILLGVVEPVGVKDRLLVSWIVRFVPVGTVIKIGDQPDTLLNALQVTVVPVGCVASQL
jgi:hypothetical protein